DALSLLYKVMQMAGVTKTYEREGLVDLLKAVEMHPLSIELVGPHLKNMGPEEIVADFQKLLDKFKGEAEVERNRVRLFQGAQNPGVLLVEPAASRPLTSLTKASTELDKRFPPAREAEPGLPPIHPPPSTPTGRDVPATKRCG